MDERLTRDRWISEGLAVLEREGAEALAANRMSKRLGVTRGSFYWHFQSSRDFEGAVLGAWEERWTRRVVAAAQTDNRPPRDSLFHLIRQTGGRDAQVYASAKRLALESAELAGHLRRIDAARTNLVATILRSGGVPAREAEIRAGIVYAWAMGQMIIAGDDGRVSAETAEALTRFAFDEV